MQLLTAVNQILSILGEVQVSSIEAQHSSVYKILQALEDQKKLLLEPGWWFNTGVSTMYPNSFGTVEAPVDALYLRDVTNTLTVVVRDDMLYDTTNNTEYFTTPIELFYTYNIAFENLPHAAASVVLYRAAMEVYVSDLGVDSQYQYYQYKEATAFNQLQKAHLRSMKYNSKLNASYACILEALRG